MTGRSDREPPPPSRASLHERKLLHICGIAAVEALFERDPRRIERLFFEARFGDRLASARRQLARLRRPYRQVESAELARIAGTVHHGGVVAVVTSPPLPAFRAEAAADWAKDGRLLLILDGIGNPHNLGAIARSAAYFGVERVILSDRPEQAVPSDASYRIAEGGLDRMTLYRAQLPADLAGLGAHYRLVGTTPQGGIPLAAVPRDRPVALLLGNEESGLNAATRAACDTLATIPGSGGVQSLNVAAAAAVLLYAFSAR